MTETDNKALMQEIFRRLAEGDGALLFESMAEDVCWAIIGGTKWSGIYEGKQAVLRDLITPLRANLAERPKTVAQRFIVDGDTVAVEARGHNATRAGAPYRNEYCFVFEFADGRIRHITEYSDTQLIAGVLDDPKVLGAAAS